MSKRFYTPGHYIRLVHSGGQYFETLCHLIDSAQQTLHLLVYIFDEDETGEMVLNHLLKASARGVHVYFMADGYGSANLNADFRYRMQKAGIRFRFFSPLSIFRAMNAGRRLHQKICLADAKRALVGGINISDKYHGSETEKPWFDFALYIEGPLCNDINKACKNIWGKKYNSQQSSDKNPHLHSGGMMARMVQNDWLRGKNEISASYKKKLRLAKSSIIIIASYFLPSRRLLKILLSMAKQGRSITIILSKDSDVPFIKPAIAYLYNTLLKSGIRIFEYHEAVLHAKAVVVDQRWVSIGSHNMNHLSEYLSMEMNIEVLDKNFGEVFFNELILLTKHECEEITLEAYERKNSIISRIKQWSSYKIVSISERILDVFSHRLK